MSWPTVQASELMLKRGGSVNPIKFPEETFELFSIPAYDSDQPEILSGKDIGSSKSCIEPNDVLLSKIVPHIRRCWVVPDGKEYRQIGSGEWIIFRDERFYPQFLKHFLTSDCFHHQFMNTVAGVGGSLVRARPAFVEKIQIPLPPLEEQKRIAAILDKADSVRRKRQQAIDLADDFLRSVFLDMFGDPVTNPKGWEIVELREHIARANNGLSRRRKIEENIGDIVLRLQDVHYDGIRFGKELNRIALEDSEKARFELESGDLLFIRVNGNPEYVGRSAVFEGFDEPVYHNDHLIRLKMKSSFNPKFLSYTFNHPGGKAIISTKTKTSAGQHTISQGGIESLEIFYPPRELQEMFVKIQDSLQSQLILCGNSGKGVESLFNSLSQKAFAGEL